MGMTFKTGKCRLSFNQLIEGKEENGRVRYTCCLMVPKSDTEQIKYLQDRMKEAYAEAIAKWGKKPVGFKWPLHDGDAKALEQEEAGETKYSEFKGYMYFNLSTLYRPGIIDLNLQPIMSQDELYSGCYVRVSMNFYTSDYKNQKRLSCGLQNVQKIADGERFGGVASASDEFNDGMYSTATQGAPSTQPPAITEDFEDIPF